MTEFSYYVQQNENVGNIKTFVSLGMIVLFVMGLSRQVFNV